MKKTRLSLQILLFTVILLMVVHSSALCYEIETHRAITSKAINVGKLSAYLQDNFGIQVSTQFQDVNSNEQRSAFSWIVEGSGWEDNDPRYVNHYHNPLTNKGLTDSIDFFAQSALDWGITGSWYLFNNDYSWQKARDYYLNALTKTTKVERDGNFAKAFRSIGQIVHLIQDMAQPAHVRNDNHAILSAGSKFWERYDFYESFVYRKINPYSYSVTAFPTFGKLVDFWDGDKYIDSPSQQSGFYGLAEFTSYNFFSEETIFTEDYLMDWNPFNDKHYFPHPRKEFTNAQLIEQIAEDGGLDRVYYIKGYQSERLAAYSFFWDNSRFIPTASWLYNLDDAVYKNYASILIPKAISYSAGLLNYFFRGKINMTPDQNSSGQYVIKNEYNEYMSGLFSLYYDDTGDNRRFVASWSLSINANSHSSTVTFTPPTYPEPKQKGTYILAFQGRLGNESGAVVGRAGIPLCQSNISISGPDQAVDGTQYTATGGTEPYTWSISKGSIDSNGVVIVSGQCGAATVTATDACGVTQSKVVTITPPTATISISGPDAPTDGSQYTATGGIEPFAWSISKGSITQTGVVTVSGQCGAATVTAADACGNQVSKDVRMSSGVWVSVSRIDYTPPASHSVSCTNSDLRFDPPSCTSLSGSSMSIVNYNNFSWSGGYYKGVYHPSSWYTSPVWVSTNPEGLPIEQHGCLTEPADTGVCPPDKYPPDCCENLYYDPSLPPYVGGSLTFGYQVRSREVFEWRCP